MEDIWNPTRIAPKPWDEGCRRDEARNDFIVPLLLTHLTNESTSQVIDVGCGTGYIVSEVLSKCKIEHTKFTLLDRDSDMAAFAEQRFRYEPNVKIVLSTLDLFAKKDLKQQFDICICCYTGLEVIAYEKFASDLMKLTGSGKLIIFIPDAVEDLIDYYSRELREVYSGGEPAPVLNKSNEFTGKEQTFIGRQPIDFLLPFTAIASPAVTIHSYTTKNNKRHFGIVLNFGRPRQK